MSGLEALAVVGIVSNILQLVDFCAKITDRTLEFCGRTAQLPGGFDDLRVVMSLVGVNLKKLQSRIEAATPDRDTLQVLKNAVRIIERDAKIIHQYLEKHLPAPGASWTRVTAKAIHSVFSESKIKHATETILQKCELLGQTVTASLPTADEIAKAVSERSASTIDRRLSVMINRMQEKAASKTAVNQTTFNNQQHQHRHSNTGNEIHVKGQTHINNTYVTIQMSYDGLGAQLDQGTLSNASLTVPGTNLPFHLLHKSISNPDIPGSTLPPRRMNPPLLPHSGPGFVVDEEGGQDEDSSSTPRGTSPRPNVPRSATIGGTHTPRSLTPQPPAPDFNPSSYNNRNTSTSYPGKTFPSLNNRPPPTDTQSEIWDTATLAPSVVPSNIGSSIGLGFERLPNSPRSPRASDPSHRPSITSTNSARTHRSSLSNHSITSANWVSSPISTDQLHTSVFELDGGLATAAASLCGMESASEANTASEVWSETMVALTDTDGASTTSSAVTMVEDHDAINTVNAYIRSGAAAVTVNPSDAKRAYMSAMKDCKRIVAYSPDFCVRKFRALTLSAIGLSLCTMDRERYLNKARDYNAQAMTAANRSGDATLVHRVQLDEADLQMKEARMFEKKGAGADATMRQFSAFGTYQTIAGELEGRAWGVSDCNTRALALLGCGKMAGILMRNPGTFRTSQGNIMPARSYLDQALECCSRGREVRDARTDDLALLRDTEAQVRKIMVTSGRQ